MLPSGAKFWVKLIPRSCVSITIFSVLASREGDVGAASQEGHTRC